MWKYRQLICLTPAIILAIGAAIALGHYVPPVYTIDEVIADETTIATTSTTSSTTETTTETTTTHPPKRTIATTQAEIAEISLSSIVEDADYADGIYYGSGTGYRGTITVAVTIEDGIIIAIDVVSTEDDEPYFTNASTLLNQIITTQSTNVDTVTGATYSSVGLIEAVRNALSQAAISDTAISENIITVTTPIPQKSTTVNTKKTSIKRSINTTEKEGNFPYADGTYTGTGEGYRSDITVAVTIENGYIVKIEILSSGDDNPYFSNATQLIDTILETQQTNVDAISGATFSSYGILDAIDDALSHATPKVTTTATTAGVTMPSLSSTTTSTHETTTTAVVDDTDQEETKTLYRDGIYTGTVECEPDDNLDFEPYSLSVTIQIENDIITDIYDITGSGRDYIDDNAWYINRAANGTSRYIGVIEQILTNGFDSDIDAVSGATCSSNAIVDAVLDALNQAFWEES